MTRLLLILPFATAACSTQQVPPPSSPHAETTPVAAKADLRGRWTVTAVNGRPEPGLWLELGAEGAATITRKGNGVYVASPQPPTRTFLGCNWWDPSGWTRSGDTLTLGTEMSRQTERGCDPATEALDDEAYAIVTRPMTMEFTPPDRLRLANEYGTLALMRTGARAE